MTTCFCGRDHKADHLRGAEGEAHRRAERFGAAFETITDGSVGGDGVELRATQTDNGAWQATVYRAAYEEIPMCEVGAMEFVGYAATRDRAESLARQFAASLEQKWASWRAEWAARDALRAQRNAAS